MSFSLKEKIEELEKHDDMYWYKEIAKNDSYAKTLTQEQLEDVINKSIQSAEDVYNKLINKSGILEPFDYMRENNINITYSHVDGFRLYIAMYNDRNREVDINLTAINKIKDAIVRAHCDGILDPNKVLEVALMHELYHYFEFRDETIYTYRKIVPKRFLFKKYLDRSIFLSEVGALHFSKIAAKIDYSPKLFEKILTI